LVVVSGGAAEEYAPDHVLCCIVDRDNIGAGDGPAVLPRDLGFKELAERAGLVEGVDYVVE
jgi:hypothetical protein